ncbi:SMI1/KNR4 family protein [Paenibacillus pabuli]|uniref:SMI1/KNR4 family protein n=1 Tax=Paenibacillus pabuli TaxID=1472 RepID=UPI001FFE3415|nr:SMI1/KNR4 family protein [Paenibacillus pabuli]UPK43640.1 SMI1/KNR4 family protein [Paenibacillus pabuli]
MPEQRIYELMDELDILLEEKVQDEENRELLTTYRKFAGVTNEQLDAFEQEHGIRLPSDFRAFYKRKNGSGYGFKVLYPSLEEGRETEPFYLLSLERIQKGHSTLVENRLDDYYTEEEIRELDPRIKPYLFQKKWITFGMLGGGSLCLMFDFDPTEQGTYGQIIMYIHDPDFVYYVAGTFTELLEQSNRNLRALEAIEY